MLAMQICENSQISPVEMPLPDLPEGGALVDLAGCGLCGSDLDKVINRKALPGTVLGHEVVGTIRTLHPDHGSAFNVGDRIVTAHHVPCKTCHFCQNGNESMCRQFKVTNLIPGGFSQVIGLSRGHLKHTVFKVPDSISNVTASCVEPLACILKALRRGGVIPEGSVSIIGLGFIGLLAGLAYQQVGMHTIGFEPIAERLDFALSHRMVNQAYHPTSQWQEAYTNIQENTPADGVDIVFMTAITPETCQQALACVRDGGTIILFANGQPAASFPVSELYFREINLVSSYSPSLEDLQKAAHLIFNQKLDVSPLYTHQFRLEQLPEALKLYQIGKTLKVFVTI